MILIASSITLPKYPVDNPVLRIREIIEALNVLEHNPMIGRPSNNDKRELVIGRRSHGYVALYRYVAEVDTVFVLTVRSWFCGALMPWLTL